MKRIYKYFAVSFGVAAVIYILNLLWMPFICGKIDENSGGPAFYLNLFVQIAIIALPTIVSIVKFKFKAPFLSLMFLYLFCLIYEIQGYFLIIDTTPHAFLSYIADNSKSESALCILILSGIVMLITTLFTQITLNIIRWFKQRKMTDENQLENDGDTTNVSEPNQE